MCKAHDVVMKEGRSKTKFNPDGTPKNYWFHYDAEQGMCFGKKYLGKK